MKAEHQPRPRAECAHAPHCTHYAMGQRKTKTGLANLCLPHLQEYDHARAMRWCELRGLMTRESQIEYIREQVTLLSRTKTTEDYRAWQKNPRSETARRFVEELNAARKLPVRERQPGDDDEEIEE